MKSIIILALLSGVNAMAKAQFHKKKEPFAHTFSIVARDEKTGELGVAVQSHWFSVGTTVSFGEAGAGVVATQAMVNKSFGPRGLQLMKEGLSASEALERLLGEDEGREMRQVAMMDARGGLAHFTGSLCIDYAGHLSGENYSVQSNMMLNDKVNKAMAGAFENSKGQPLAERMLVALEAGQQAGGDIRGQQSAALLVVPALSLDRPWDERKVDLRVDDHATPIQELKRLLTVHRAYEHMNNGDLAVEKGDMKKAMEEYNQAMKLSPANLEMQYWTAITMANNKQVKEAAAMLQKIYLKDKNWRELTKRLPQVKILLVNQAELNLLTQ